MKKFIIAFILPTFIVSVFAVTEPATNFKTPNISKEEFDKLSKEEQQKILKTLPPPSLVPPQVEKPAGTVNCFDYYKFGSVQVDASPNLAVVSTGIPLNFSGTIKNDNDYPIVEGQVYAKIFFKDQKTDSLAHQNGYQVVDQFTVLDDISLNAKENKPISFDWQVPKYAQSGDYEIAFYFISAKRYNLLGLSFTDDVTGNKASFSIKSDVSEVAYFDKNNVKLNDTLFRFAAFPPHFTNSEKVTAYTTLINPNNKETVVSVTWTLYAWDAILPQHRKNTKTELITLKPKEKKVLSYEAKPTDSSVTYLVVETKERDAKSILNIRFVRDGIDETRINFPSITKYPITKGEESTLFSCVHSTNLPIVKDNVLTLTLKDAKDKVIHTYKYSGDITGDMMGVKDTFIPKNTLSTFTLTAKLERKGELVDQVIMKYDCDKIDATKCDVTSVGSVGQLNVRALNIKDNATNIGASVILLVILIAGGIIIKRRKEGQVVNETPSA